MGKATTLAILTGLFSITALAEWKQNTDVDEFDGHRTDYVASSWESPLSILPPPYDDLKARLVVTCSGAKWNALPSVEIQFNSRLNFDDGRPKQHNRHNGITGITDAFETTIAARWANEQKRRGAHSVWNVWKTSPRTAKFLNSGWQGSKELVWDLLDRDWVKMRMFWGGDTATFQFNTSNFAHVFLAASCPHEAKPSRRRTKIRKDRIAAGDLFGGHELLIDQLE